MKIQFSHKLLYFSIDLKAFHNISSLSLSTFAISTYFTVVANGLTAFKYYFFSKSIANNICKLHKRKENSTNLLQLSRLNFHLLLSRASLPIFPILHFRLTRKMPTALLLKLVLCYRNDENNLFCCCSKIVINLFYLLKLWYC